MIDLDAIKSHVLRPEHGGSAMPDMCLIGGADLAALVAEVEHLRGERAAVVAWLRAEFDTDSVREAADDIERGDHRREEEK